MKDVLLRHYPELTPEIGDIERVFAPWHEVGQHEPAKKNPVARAADTVKAYMPFGE